MKLYTIGYEGIDQKTLFDTLLDNGVEVLVDVRQAPISRKPGFSKKALESGCGDYHINYLLMQSLGTPRDIRVDYRKDRDWTKYTIRYKSYLSTRLEDVQKLAGIIQKSTCCLLCFEADPQYCHRSYVAEQVVKIVGDSLEVVHLIPMAEVKTA